jgi:hypothetical protein
MALEDAKLMHSMGFCKGLYGPVFLDSTSANTHRHPQTITHSIPPLPSIFWTKDGAMQLGEGSYEREQLLIKCRIGAA